MLHLENFFEKSFALLLTTPRESKRLNFCFTFDEKSAIIKECLLKKKSISRFGTFSNFKDFCLCFQ